MNLVLLILGVLLLAGGTDDDTAPHIGPAWQDQIRGYVDRIEAVTGEWPGLAEFLIAVAYWESSHHDGTPPNPAACRGSCGPTSERGLYQMRPKTADWAPVDSDPSLLFDPRRATALAAWGIWRLGTRWGEQGQLVDFLAVRRGWKYPRLVKDADESDPDSAGIRKRFATALEATDLPQSLMGQRAIPSSVHWPGIDVVMKAVME